MRQINTNLMKPSTISIHRRIKLFNISLAPNDPYRDCKQRLHAVEWELTEVYTRADLTMNLAVTEILLEEKYGRAPEDAHEMLEEEGWL